MNVHYEVGQHPITYEEIRAVLKDHQPLRLSEPVKQDILGSRAYLESRIANGNERFYGINTGFGSLYKVAISPDEIVALQNNLIRSHACGAGPRVDPDIVRIMLFLKILSLCKGKSGVTLALVELMVALYNASALPVIYSFGSLGASGDLAPLAHLALSLIGEGEMYFEGEIVPADQVLEKLKLKPIQLSAKEGLALVNGTQYSNAYAVHAILEGEMLLEKGCICAAAAVDAFDCNMSPFHQGIQEVRNHRGQEYIAGRIRSILDDSEIAGSPEKELQDPYAFRCIPQVLGASYAALEHAREIITNEVNAVTDNPLVLEDYDAILSGGNFHAQPIALVLDYLAIAFAELGNISERRTYQLLSGQRDLPEYLVASPGLQSGLMIAQYTAASLVNRNKLLANPASTDSIISSKGQEDHVSMSANAGIKLYELIDNLWAILGIEWLVAMQALEFRKPLRSGHEVERLWAAFRKRVSPLSGDRMLSDDMRQATEFLRFGDS